MSTTNIVFSVVSPARQKENQSQPTHLSPPLLLRSTSNHKPLIYSRTVPIRGKLNIELLPASLLTSCPRKVYDFMHGVTNRLTERLSGDQMNLVPSTSPRLMGLQDGYGWWNELFRELPVSPFARMLSTMLYFQRLFAQRQPNKALDSTSPLNGKSLDQSSMCLGKDDLLDVRMGDAVSIGIGNYYAWAPGSIKQAMELVLSWARLTIEQSERLCEQTNLARQSFGVLENWSDLIQFGRLSSLATKSEPIEPEEPSFFEEEEEANVSQGEQSSTKPSLLSKLMRSNDSSTDPNVLFHDDHDENERPASICVIVEDQGSLLAASDGEPLSVDWLKLVSAWDVAVAKRAQSNATIHFKLQENSDLDLDLCINEILGCVPKLQIS